MQADADVTEQESLGTRQQCRQASWQVGLGKDMPVLRNQSKSRAISNMSATSAFNHIAFVGASSR